MPDRYGEPISDEQYWQQLKAWWEYHVACTIAADKKRREASKPEGDR